MKKDNVLAKETVINNLFRNFKKNFGMFSFTIPALVLFTFIIIIPFIKGIGISMTNWDGISTSYKYVGFKNFHLLFNDDAVIQPIKNTLFFTIMTLVLVNILGLMLALLLNSSARFENFFKSVFFVPISISLVLSSFIWTYIYSDLFPKIIGINGLLGNASTVMIGIVIICVWRDAGLAMMIYTAALKGIPKEYYEASKVDGANAIQRFFNVTLPLLMPAVTINITLWLGWGLKVFDYPMAATGGGPGKASETLAMYVYKYAFPYNKAGYGQAAALVMMVGIFIITFSVTALLRRMEVEA